MIHLTRILVPTDFSPPSSKALQYAVALARVHRSELLLLHVITPPVYPVEAAMISRTYQEIEVEIRKHSEEQIEALQAREVGELPSRTRVLQGAPFVEIIRTARDEEIDLIVIATHGYSGLKHVLLGSVAEKVVRKAPCPVLTVKEKGREFVLP